MNTTQALPYPGCIITVRPFTGESFSGELLAISQGTSGTIYTMDSADGSENWYFHELDKPTFRHQGDAVTVGPAFDNQTRHP